MKEVTTHYARTHLSGLLKEVQQGETFIILQGKVPVGSLTPICKRRARRRKAGRPTSPPIKYAADAFDPLSPEELKGWGLHGRVGTD